MPLPASVTLGFLCGVVILILLGFKWALDRRAVLIWSIAVSALAGSITYAISNRLHLFCWQVILIELSLIGITSGAALAWRFYRDPERIPPKIQHIIVSPADGKVIYIRKITHGGIATSGKKGSSFQLSEIVPAQLLDDAAWLVGISMSYLDVHVNRAPIAGTVACIKHIRGRFTSLKKPEAVFQNERMLTVIDGGWLRVAVIQIASRLVRRIISYMSEGGVAILAQRIGRITFGSQVDMVITASPNLKIMIEPGQQVRAGVSIVAISEPEK